MSDEFQIDLSKLNEQRLKEKAPRFDSFGESKQTFNQVGMFQAIDGFVVLRGRRGRRDQIYPPEQAFKRLTSFYRIYLEWSKNGFFKQCQELRLVLEEFLRKFQQSMAQRIATGAVPPWFTPKISEGVTKMVQRLKMDNKIIWNKSAKSDN